MRRISAIIWKARIFGFFCGGSMAVGTALVAQVMQPTVHETHTSIDEVIIPFLLFMVGIIGWFSRDAYNRISARLDRMEEAMNAIEVLGNRVERIDKDIADLGKISSAVEQWRDFREEWRDFSRATLEWRQAVERRIDALMDDGR